eukprot:6461883-Pyramimonas_sp.AAC.2
MNSKPPSNFDKLFLPANLVEVVANADLHIFLLERRVVHQSAAHDVRDFHPLSWEGVYSRPHLALHRKLDLSRRKLGDAGRLESLEGVCVLWT